MGGSGGKSGETPALGLASEEVRAVLESASLAAAGPWYFVVRPERIEMHVSGELSRETRLVCGAALMNLRLALQGFGIRPLVTLLPGAKAPGAQAVLRLGGYQEPSDETLDLLVAARTRRRGAPAFLDAEVPAPHGRLLARAAETERAWLHLMSGHADPLVAVLCSFSDDPVSELRAGQAMQRVRLTAVTVGLSACELAEPFCLSAVRGELRWSLGGSLVPQTLLRIGFEPPLSATW